MQDGVSIWLKSNDEKRSFQYFLEHAAPRLGGAIQSPFWSREILQAAIYTPSIRHLVVALGAAYEQFASCESQTSQTAIESSFALRQCNQSIRHLTQQNDTSVPRKSAALGETATASILFAVFAIIQGHQALAMDHVRSGLRIVQDLETDRPPESPGFYPVSTARTKALLLSLYLQMRSIFTDEITREWSKDLLMSADGYLSSYNSLADACDEVVVLRGNILAFFERNTLAPPLSSLDRENVLQQQDTLRRRLDKTRLVLEEYIAREPEIKQTEKVALALLDLHYDYLAVQLSMDVLRFEQREFDFDALEPQFQTMLANCEKIVQATAQVEPVCSFGLGVVMPLHMIAARCRNQETRQRAVELLQEGIRREGLWDSARVARVVGMTIELEEKQQVLHGGRVREVKVRVEDEHTTRLTFVVSDRSYIESVEVGREVHW